MRGLEDKLYYMNYDSASWVIIKWKVASSEKPTTQSSDQKLNDITERIKSNSKYMYSSFYMNWFGVALSTLTFSKILFEKVSNNSAIKLVAQGRDWSCLR